VLQGLQKVFLSFSSSCLSKEQVLGKTVEEEAETPFQQETWFSRLSSRSDCSSVSNINKLYN